MTPGYRALREGAAWFDISERARIRATGEDRIRLLHALASNVIEGLGPGEWTETFFLNPQGRIQARARVYVLEDAVLVETDGSCREALLSYLESYIIMDDVSLEDSTEATAAIAVEGPLAASVLSGTSVEPGERRPSSLSGSSGFWVEIPPANKAALVAELESAGAVAAAPEDVETGRVENKVPRYGVDYSDANIPHETQLLDLVSFSKGCYVGQEIVERVRSQGKVNRLLVPVEIDATDVPDDLTARLDDQPMGTVTSPTPSPASGKVRGFALLRREAVEVGTFTVNGRPARALPW